MPIHANTSVIASILGSTDVSTVCKSQALTHCFFIMNQRIKEAWIKALRSGDYKQGRETLNCNGEFCCLGVLTDLYIKEYNRSWSQLVDEPDCSLMCFEDGGDLLPESVIQWADVTSNDPIIDEADDAIYRISYYNDEERYDFNQLADLIQEHL